MERYYRVILSALLSIALALLIWYHGELSAIQIGCAAVMLLAGIVRLVGNPASNTIRIAAGIPMIAAGFALFWTLSQHPNFRGMVIYGLLAMLFGWFMLARKSGRSDQGTDSCKKL